MICFTKGLAIARRGDPNPVVARRNYNGGRRWTGKEQWLIALDSLKKTWTTVDKGGRQR